MTELSEDARTNQAHLLDVTFLDLNTNETARFAVPGEVTLERAWDMAYDELGEARRPNDVLEARSSGQPLTGDLDKTIRYVKEHLVPDLRFQIHGEQGGA
jgi:hypothetical protein